MESFLPEQVWTPGIYGSDNHDDLPYAAVQKNAGDNSAPDDVYAEIKAAGKFLAT